MKQAMTAKEAACAKLRELREVFNHSPARQEGLAAWWAALAIDDRRLILAFCGFEDGEKAARRHWQQMLMEQRDAIIARCKAFARVIAVMELV